LHEIAFAAQYCIQEFAHAQTPSHNSVRFLVPECTWHMRILDGLLAKPTVSMEIYDVTDAGSVTTSAGLQARVVTADAAVQAFFGIVTQDSALGEYFLKKIVRHICG
jgi:hypothetical protein